jgi:serine phosphatase RsbU (regulator of sigma subunit)/anti-anti-sigma regulatory factor
MTAPAASSPARVVYSVEDASVSEETCGPAALFRFSGKCSPALVEWLAEGLRESRQHGIALDLKALEGTDEAFAGEVVRFAKQVVRRKRQVALIDPPGRMVELAERLGATDLLPVLSCEGALREGTSIADAVLKERAALHDIASRLEVNPLWRKLDQEGMWLCPLCGSEARGVRLWSVAKPGLGPLRGMRAHLVEQCPAWRAGRRVPLPASALDAFLLEINRRKASAEQERRWRMSQEMEALQERVGSMEDLERTLEEAKRKQLHLLPVDPQPDPVADIAVVYRPLQSVSGDFLDFYSLDGDRFGVALGDVSGHGIETAITMGMAKMALRVRSQALGTLRELMVAANRDLFTELRRSAFVTGVFAVIERASRRLSYIRAGHPPPLLVRQGGACEELNAHGLPFGVDQETRFAAALEERDVPLAPGDVLLLYTDGVTEAGPDSAQFGVERLKEALLAAPATATAREILDAVIASLDGFLAGRPLGDDLTLICLKIS